MTKTTIKQRIYSAVYDSIVEGEYKENDIITEISLATKYNVSKSPVREALIELCKENILRTIPRTGYQVVPISLNELLKILEFRQDLEVMMLRKSFDKITPEDIEMLEQLSKPAESTIGKVKPHWNQNLEFHLALGKLYDNDNAYEVLHSILLKCSRSISQYFYSAWRRSRESKGFYHQAIIKAVVDNDLELACQMLSKDIMVVKEEIKELF